MKTIAKNLVRQYLMSNPGQPVYLVNDNAIISKFTYYKRDIMEVVDYWIEDDTPVKVPLTLLEDPNTWKEGDILYTLKGIEEFLNTEPKK